MNTENKILYKCSTALGVDWDKVKHSRKERRKAQYYTYILWKAIGVNFGGRWKY